MGQVNDAVPFDVIGCKKVEEYLEGIVGVFEHAGRDFVGEFVAVPFAVDVKVRDAYGGAVWISVWGGEIQAREDDGFSGAAQLAFEFQDDAFLCDVEREGDAGDVGGDQRDGDGLRDDGREAAVGCGRFDFAGGEVGVGFFLREFGHLGSLRWQGVCRSEIVGKVAG